MASVRLILGVLDVSYTDPSSTTVTTTGDVAEILEKNYMVMGTFFNMRREKIADVLADSMANSIQALLNGRPDESRSSLTYGADQKIEAEFRSFIFANEMSILYKAFSGFDLSAAAARGVNKRKLHPYAQKNKARPAFVDSGLFVQSFRAWTER